MSPVMNRKRAILKAAIELFAERGFTATPTSAVAKRARVAEGLIFHHFGTKEGIFMHVLEELMDVYLEGIESTAKKAKTGLQAIEKMIHFHFRFSEKRSKEFLVVIRDFPFDLMKPGSSLREVVTAGADRLTNLFTESIARGQEDGSIRDLPPEETAFILRAMLNGLSRLKMLGALGMPEITSETIDFCRRSIAK